MTITPEKTRNMAFTCAICSDCYATKDELLFHSLECHQNCVLNVMNEMMCWYCNNTYKSRSECIHHLLTSHHYTVTQNSMMFACALKEYYEQCSSSCPSCKLEMRSLDEMQRHLTVCNTTSCPYCAKEIKWKKNLKGHMETCKLNPRAPRQFSKKVEKTRLFVCNECKEAFTNRISYLAHQQAHNNQNISLHSNDYGTVKLHQQSLAGRCGIYKMDTNMSEHDPQIFLNQMESLLKSTIYDDMDENLNWKGSVYLYVVMSKMHKEHLHKQEFCLTTKLEPINDFETWYSHMILKLENSIENFLCHGSNWSLDEIKYGEFRFLQFKSLSGSGTFPIDSTLSNKNAVINLDVDDNQCFRYAILCSLHAKEIQRNRHRASKYQQYLHEINMKDIDEPVEISNISKFESQNPDIKVNVHYWNECRLRRVLYNSSDTCNRRYIVNLLFIHNASYTRNHYLPILHFNRLMNHDGQKSKYCERCYRKFDKRYIHKYEKHLKFCLQNKLQTEEMPKGEKCKRRFMRHASMLSPAFVMYSDMECFIDKKTNQHKPACVSALIIRNETLKIECVPVELRHLLPPEEIQTFVGVNCVSDYLNFINDVASNIYDLDITTKLFRQKLKLNTHEEEEFNKSLQCYLCKKQFNEREEKNKEHDHFSGKYRGASCTRCNMSLRLQRRFLPIFFHNLRGYDMHFLCKHGFGKFEDWKFDVIAQSREKFMRVVVKKTVDASKETGKEITFNIHFLDTFNFLPAKLSLLAESLPTLKHTLKMKSKYSKVTDDILSGKGIYPYTYFDSLERFNETCLPSKSAFYNDLEGSNISDDEYENAKRAWIHFDCKTFKDYTIAYLHMDVYLLTDVFEYFRKQCLKEDGLDPVHYVSMPALSMESAFKMSNEEIELLSDPSMHELFERGIRGGMAFTNKHCLSANNHYMTTYDKNAPCIWLLYIDENNLYGNCLRQSLPYRKFQWCKNLTIDEIKQWKSSDNVGYILEVDLSYPKEIHDHTQELPLAPEHKRISKNDMTEYMKHKWCEMYPNRKFNSSKKLIMCQNDKECYVVHIAILQFYLEMGMIITKMHGTISFEQKPWLRSYIDNNTAKRKQAKNSFEKDFYKFKSNSLFGKTMENVRKHKEYKLINDAHRLDILAIRPLIDSFDIISEDLIGLAMLKEKCILNKPVYVGQAVLDLSKLIMYKLYYKKLKCHPLIKSINVGGGDTDSLFLEIETCHNIDLYRDILSPMTMTCLDTSNYHSNHFMYSNDHRAELGYFKDETAGKLIMEMILLKPKMYSIKISEEKNGIRRAKGIKRSVVRKFTHEKYKEVYENETEIMINYKNLVSKNHVVKTKEINKRALSFWEDKRAWQTSNFSLPYGHYKLCVKNGNDDDNDETPLKRRKL